MEVVVNVEGNLERPSDRRSSTSSVFDPTIISPRLDQNGVLLNNTSSNAELARCRTSLYRAVNTSRVLIRFTSTILFRTLKLRKIQRMCRTCTLASTLPLSSTGTILSVSLQFSQGLRPNGRAAPMGRNGSGAVLARPGLSEARRGDVGAFMLTY